VSYFAAALTRDDTGWSATELDLDSAEGPDDVAELLREVDPEADVSLLLVEADDEYLVVMRLDEGEDLRVFASDATFAEQSRIGEVLLADLKESAAATAIATELVAVIDASEVNPDVDLEVDDAGAAASDDPVEEAPAADEVETGHPLGDADLLADLGTPARELLALCAHEGMLPADVMIELCTHVGCATVLEELREV
jgi:putative tRNA adenosine deaminase-associated protein